MNEYNKLLNGADDDDRHEQNEKMRFNKNTTRENARNVERRMKCERLITIASFISAFLIGWATQSISRSCHVRIPEKFQQNPPGWISPNGEPESVRYQKSYEAFWWNCVMIKASELTERCPFMCSGTLAATSGCADGAHDVEHQIRQLLNKYDTNMVLDYLNSIASKKEGKEKIQPYFPNGPRPENVNE